MNTHELAWAAGFFDGEGHAGFHRRPRITQTGGRQTYSAIVLDIRQTDRRVLERFQNAIGLGRIYGPYNSNNPNAKPFYAFSLAKFEYVQAATAKLWRWLSPVKKQQLATTLQAYLAEPRLKTGRKKAA
jgi:hypothetical protein